MSSQFSNPEEFYTKDVNLKRDDVKTILEWTRKRSDLPQLTECQVILFLHSCYYRIESAKITIEKFFTFKTRHSDLLEHASEEIIRRVLTVNCVKVLPKKTPEGDIILFLKLLDSQPKNYVCLEHIKVACMVMLLYLHQHGPPNGLIVLLDMHGATLGHLFRLHLMALKRIFYFFQEAAPVRVKGIHLINLVPFTEKFMAVIRPFLKKELLDLLKLHPDYAQSLYSYIPKGCLPQEYGGQLPTLENICGESVDNLIQNFDFFEWFYSLKVDESKKS